MQAAAATRKHGPVELQLGADVPELISDSERLRTVLVNLLTNADHAVEGKADGTVTLLTRRLDDRRAAIIIRDTGKGIADDDLTRIFDPYFTTRRAGTGLGLAIAKNIVDGLGGSISVSTQAGVGTDFRIELADAPSHGNQ